MRYSTSIEFDYKILELLSREKEYALYDLPKELEKSYRTVFRHKKRLEEQNFIKLSRTEPSSKKGKDRNIYTLTLQGIIALLKHPELKRFSLEDYIRYIDIISDNYCDLLPLIFGKWQFVKEHGIVDYIAGKLIQVLENFMNPLLKMYEEDSKDLELLERFYKSLDKTKRFPKKDVEKLQTGFKTLKQKIIEFDRNFLTKLDPDQNQIYRKVFLEQPTFVSARALERFIDFLNIASKDEDLRRFIDIELQNIKEDFTTYLTNLNSWINEWQNFTS